MCGQWSEPQLERFLVCAECGELRERADGTPAALRQLCACELRELAAEGGRPIARWSGYDFNLKAELCRLCAACLLRSGHRYSTWFCEPCREAVREAHERLGSYVIPLGRHSLHAGLRLNPRSPKREQTRQARELVAFMHTLSDQIGALERWRASLVAGSLAEAGLASPAPLVDYLALASSADGRPRSLAEGLLQSLAS